MSCRFLFGVVWLFVLRWIRDGVGSGGLASILGAGGRGIVEEGLRVVEIGLTSRMALRRR